MARKKRKHSLLVGITSRAAMSVAAGLLFLSYASVLFNPASAWVMSLFGLMFFPLLFINLALAVWALLRRSSAAAIPIVALLPALLVSGWYIQFSGSDLAPDDDDVKIVSYNVGRFSLYDGQMDRSECTDSVVALLKRQQADIICIQEFFMKDPDKVKSFLRKSFPGYYEEYYVYPTKNGCYGNVTLSRFPLVSKGKLDFEKSSNLALYCDCIIRGVPLRIYNCHFQSYAISLSHIAEGLKGDYKKMFLDTEEKMKFSIIRRPQQVDAVMKDIENCPTGAIVTGDFNDTPMSYTYMRLKRGRRDSFVDAGKGFGASFTYLRPFLRIDYVLFPERFRAVSHKVLKARYSDHFPIVTEISLKETAEN